MSIKILVVDDEALNRLLVETLLNKEGFNVTQAESGEKAFAYLEKETPDLILLDIMMPGMDGFEVCSKLKNEEATRSIPVILLTALSNRSDIEEGIKAGADEFITKPFDGAELLLRIRSLLKIQDINHYLSSQESLFEQLETVTKTVLEVEVTEEDEYEFILKSMLEENLELAGPSEKEKTGRRTKDNFPECAYIVLNLNTYTLPGAFYRRNAERIDRKDTSLELSIDKLKEVSIQSGRILLSNWQTFARSEEEYRKLLPSDITGNMGDIRNFIYYSDKSIEFAFFNFSREISPFDLTWFEHLIFYYKSLILILQRIKEKELEYEALANSLSKIAEIKDDAEGKHERMQVLCGLFCDHLDTSEGFKTQLIDAVSLYDLGKLLVDQRILFKKGSLSEGELEIIHQVPKYVQTVIGNNPRMVIVKEVAGGIYEHYDGSGYPYRRKGEEIPLSARIVSLANVYDTLRCTRSYRGGFSHEEALSIINEGDNKVSPKHFDPKILSVLNNVAPQVKGYYNELLQEG